MTLHANLEYLSNNFDAIQIIEADGWYHVATRGSHRQYKHATKSGRVTIPGKLSDGLSPGTWDSIQKQAGLKRDDERKRDTES